MTDPQQMPEHPIRDYLAAFVERATGITARRLGFMWTGPGRGVVTFDDAGSPPEGGNLVVDGADADHVRFLETGEDPNRPPIIPETFACERHFPHRRVTCSACHPERR